MGRKVQGKTTEQDHLAQVAKQLVKTFSYIEESNSQALFPDVAAHLWATFLELHDGRTYGMSGPNPISYDIISGWSTITGVDL